MVPILLLLGALLVGWGIYVLVTGDFVATVDIAAGLVGTGIVVVALAAVVRSLDHIARTFATRPAAEPARAPSAEAPSQPPPRRAAPAYTPEPAPASPPPAAPIVVREGDIEGHHYRFYSDGSIEAEGPRGMRRYRSIDEAREQILRERNTAQTENEARNGDARPRAPVVPAEPNYAPPRYEPRPAAPPPAGNEPYVPRYNPPNAPAAAPAPDDDEWSEPFRMLLKGEPGGSKSGKR